jgi:hypothetical protein
MASRPSEKRCTICREVEELEGVAAGPRSAVVESAWVKPESVRVHGRGVRSG